MVEASPASMEELLEHEGWVQGLARSLVHDPAAAEDLVQETWLAALRRPPMNDRPLRPWLGRVVRNFASERRRRDARRVLVDGEIERVDGAPAGEAASEAGEVRAQVVEALMELREPYRTTVMLRYYGGLEPQDIALRQSIPAATVRTRLRRGLMALRQRLEGSWQASDRSLLRGLLFLAYDGSPPPLGGAASTAGAAAAAGAAGNGLRLAAGLTVLAGGVAVVSWVTRLDPGPVAAATLDDTASRSTRDDSELELAATLPGRNLRALDVEPAPTSLALGPSRATRREPDAEQLEALASESPEGALTGIVLDGFEPVVGAEAVLVQGDRMRLDSGAGSWPDNAIRVRTDASGEFHFADVDPGGYMLAVYALGQVRQRTIGQPRGKRSRRTVWVFGSGTLAGSLWGPDGRPRVGMHVRVQSLGKIEDPATFQCWTETDASGRFEITNLPAGDYIALTKSDPAIGDEWHNDLRRPFELQPGERVRIDFDAGGSKPEFIARVRNASGEPPRELGIVSVVSATTGIEQSFPCDREGRVLGALHAGEYVDVCWTPRGGRKQDLIELSGFEQSPDGGEFELLIAGSRLWGTVAGRQSGRVFARISGSGVRATRSTLILPDGSYAFDGLGPGPWQVWFGSRRAEDATPQRIEVRSSEPVLRLDLD